MLNADSNAARIFFKEATFLKHFIRFPSGMLFLNYCQVEAGTVLGICGMGRAHGNTEQVEAFIWLSKGASSAYKECLYNIGRAYWLGISIIFVKASIHAPATSRAGVSTPGVGVKLTVFTPGSSPALQIYPFLNQQFSVVHRVPRAGEVHTILAKACMIPDFLML